MNAKKLRPYLFIAPVVILLLGLLIYPLVTGLMMSFQKTAFSGGSEFVGLQNYKDLFNEGDRFRNNVFVTVTYIASVICITIPFSYLVALLITRPTRLASFFRSVYLIPWICAPVISTMMVKTMIEPDIGCIHSFIAWLAGHEIYLLNDGLYSLIVLILHSFWRSSPFIMLFLAAGISTIPKELYEASQIDGAGKFRSFCNITVPLTANQLGMSTLMVTIWTIQDSESVFALTKGGPGHATETLAVRLFKSSFVSFDLNMGATLGIILVLISMIFLTLYLRLMMRGSIYD